MGNIWHDISEDRIFPTDFIRTEYSRPILSQ